MKLDKQMVIAHRGASGLVKHENTIEAFAKALEVGADSIECDVRKTKDGKMVVVHDEDYQGKRIRELSYRDLCMLTAEDGFLMPTLEDAILWCKGKIMIDIELKEEGYEEEVIALAKKYLSHDDFFIRTFNDDSLKKIKVVDKNIKTVLLLGVEHPKWGLFTRLSELFPLFRILKTKCDMVSPHYRLIRFGYIWRLKLWKKPVLIWTVNDSKLMEKLLIDKKAAGIITNFPDAAIEILAKNKKV